MIASYERGEETSAAELSLVKVKAEELAWEANALRSREHISKVLEKI